MTLFWLSCWIEVSTSPIIGRVIVSTINPPVISTFPVIEPPVSSTLLPSSVMILVVPTTKLPVIHTFPSIVPPVSSTLLPSSVIILVVPTTKSPVIFTFPFIVLPVSSYLLSNAVCNPLVFAMVKSPSCIVSCFPWIVSSTSPIPGNVMFEFTSNEPLIIKLLLILPPVFVNIVYPIRLYQSMNCFDWLN